MKKHTAIYRVAIPILISGLTIICALFYKTLRDNEIKTNALHEAYLLLHAKERILENNNMVQIQLLDKTFSDSLFINTSGAPVNIDSLFSSRKLCMYLGPEYCSQCVSQHIETITKHMDKVGEENIVFIFQKISRRDMIYFKNTHKITSTIISGPEMKTFTQNSLFPLFFTMDGNKKLQDVFVPLGNTPDYNTRYLKLITEKYFL